MPKKPAIAKTKLAANTKKRGLADLAFLIRSEHEAVRRSAVQTLQHAMTAGDLLIEAKGTVNHGSWGGWLRNHCNEMSDRTAQAYMRLARNREVIEAISAGTADLSIEKALAALAKPTPAEPRPTTPDDADTGTDETPTAPAVDSTEKPKVADEKVRLAGGQAIDTKALSPKAQAQIAEKLLSPEAKDRLDRIHEAGPLNGYGLHTVIGPMLESMLDKGPQSLESLVEHVAKGHWYRGAVDKISGGMQGFTVTLLDQLVDRGLVVPENKSWNLGPAFKTGEALIVVPQYHHDGAPLIAWAWTKEERAESHRQGRERMDAITAIGEAKRNATTDSELALAEFKMACEQWLPHMDGDDLHRASDYFADKIQNVTQLAKEDVKRVKRAAKHPDGQRDGAGEFTDRKLHCKSWDHTFRIGDQVFDLPSQQMATILKITTPNEEELQSVKPSAVGEDDEDIFIIVDAPAVPDIGINDNVRTVMEICLPEEAERFPGQDYAQPPTA